MQSLFEGDIHKLLSLQSETTLAEWLKEKEVAPTDDPMRDIVDYYAYLDLLHNPNTDASVFENNDILECIIERCPWYVLPHLALVNKRLFDLLHKSIGDKRNNTYTTDSVFGMNWYHMSRAIPNDQHAMEGCCNIAATRGYDLILPLDKHRSNSFFYRLPGMVAVGSDQSDRCYNLFIRSLKDIEDHEGPRRAYQGTIGMSIMMACVTSGDLRMFRYIYERLIEVQATLYITAVMEQMAYYGRVDFLDVPPSPDDDDDLFGLMVSALKGGHYKKISEYYSYTDDLVEVARGALVVKKYDMFPLLSLDNITALGVTGIEKELQEYTSAMMNKHFTTER